MGIKDSFVGSSVLTKVILILLILAQICSWIAFTIPEWARDIPNKVSGSYTGLGLWRSCQYGGTHSGPAQPCAPFDGSVLDWFIAVQAMAIFGFVGINIGFLIVVLQVFTSCLKSVSDIGMVNAIQLIVTAVLYLIGIIIFAVEYDGGYYLFPNPTGASLPKIGELRYSFGLAIVALLLEAVSGVLIFVDQRKGAGTSPA